MKTVLKEVVSSKGDKTYEIRLSGRTLGVYCTCMACRMSGWVDCKHLQEFKSDPKWAAKAAKAAKKMLETRSQMQKANSDAVKAELFKLLEKQSGRQAPVTGRAGR